MLLNHFNTGWVTFDDVSLTRVGQETVIKRSSYGIAGQIAAIRVSGDPANNGLHYLYSDHLGSASAMQKDDGSAPIITRYLPFGGYRAGSSPNEVTDRGFTGHKHNDDLGLVYMNARFYVSGIGRFASADTLVPDSANPQNYNRYSYVGNNPIGFIDPTGHFTEEAIKNYLAGNYGDDAQYMFELWKSDSEWWAMLLLAQAGDVLFASAGARELAGYYHFLGEGKDVLSGVKGSASAFSVSDDFSYFPESLNQIFGGNNSLVWGGLFMKDGKGQVVDVFHRMSVTNVYKAAEHMSTSLLGTAFRGVVSTVVPEALCSPIGGFAAGVGCEAAAGYVIDTVTPAIMSGPDFAISPGGVSPGDLIYVSAGHVFRYDAGVPSLDASRQYNRLDMYYYGNSSLYSRYHLIVNYTH